MDIRLNRTFQGPVPQYGTLSKRWILKVKGLTMWIIRVPPPQTLFVSAQRFFHIHLQQVVLHILYYLGRSSNALVWPFLLKIETKYIK